MRKSKGFTLIDFLIYIGILSFLLVGLGGIAWNIIEGGERSEASEEITYNAFFALDKIGQKIRESNSVTTPIVGGSGDSLVLDMPSADITFAVSNNILQMTEVGSTAVDLITDKIEVTNLEFKNTTQPGGPETVTINLTIGFNSPLGLPLSKDFQTTYIIPIN